MKYEGVMVQGLEDDLSSLTSSEQDDVIEKFRNILDSPNTKTDRVKCWFGNIRKLRFGKYRLLIHVSEESQTVYALAYRPRDEVYRTQTKAEVERMVKQLEAVAKVIRK